VWLGMTDEEWAFLEPLIEACRPPCKVPIGNLRQRIEGIVWRHENGAKWRAMPAEYGPWWKPAQTFIDWARLGVWERLLDLVQAQLGIALGMAFLDGTSIRAHHKAAGAAKKGARPRIGISVKPWAVRAAALGQRPACSLTARAAPSPSL
jgi:transposase